MRVTKSQVHPLERKVIGMINIWLQQQNFLLTLCTHILRLAPNATTYVPTMYVHINIHSIQLHVHMISYPFTTCTHNNSYHLHHYNLPTLNQFLPSLDTQTLPHWQWQQNQQHHYKKIYIFKQMKLKLLANWCVNCWLLLFFCLTFLHNQSI